MKQQTIEIKETPEGDLYFTIPESVLCRLNWEEGDDIDFEETEDGSFKIVKVNT